MIRTLGSSWKGMISIVMSVIVLCVGAACVTLLYLAHCDLDRIFALELNRVELQGNGDVLAHVSLLYQPESAGAWRGLLSPRTKRIAPSSLPWASFNAQRVEVIGLPEELLKQRAYYCANPIMQDSVSLIKGQPLKGVVNLERFLAHPVRSGVGRGSNIYQMAIRGRLFLDGKTCRYYWWEYTWKPAKIIYLISNTLPVQVVNVDEL